MYAYCMNNPVMLKDECGHAWWHWLIAAFVVIATAVAVVVTAGGVMAGIAAVGSVLAGGSAVSIGSTIAAGVFIAASTTLLGVGAFAGIEAIKTGSIDTFWNYGETAMWSTISAGVIGGFSGFVNFKSLNKKGFRDAVLQGAKPNSTYTKIDKSGNILSKAYYNSFGQQYIRYDFNHPHFIKAPYYSMFQPHAHNFNWKLIGDIWRYIEQILPF